jgi:GTP-sensing pleiotropic transcriptional regulator CodY
MSPFPIEHFVPITNDEHRLGRIVINQNHDGMSAEIDIVLKEGYKIFCAVDRLYKLEDQKEALDLAVQRLSEFLRQRK